MVTNDPKLLAKALKDGGYYGKEHVWNSIKKLPGDSHIYRERVETIVVRNRKEVFVKRQQNGEYSLPGGSTEPGKTKAEQAIAECHEEAHINVKDIQDSGIIRKVIKDPVEWVRKQPIRWDGYISYIFCGEYDGKYNGEVADVDEDPFIRSGRWYSTKECFKFFHKEHREALLSYLKSLNAKDEEKEVTEGYITNYFSNRKFLRQIGNTPEVEREAIVKIIKAAKKSYDGLKNTSKIRRLKKDSEKVNTTIFPVMQLEFRDGMNITIAISFANLGSEACATSDDDGQMYVLLAEDFFKLQLETQIFVMLHEIGHGRLQHAYNRNMHKKVPFFGEPDTSDYRYKKARHGKVMYPEEYADLYAIINGAKMYSILDLKVNNDDHYAVGNRELSTRYNKVYDNYRRFGGVMENGFDLFEDDDTVILQRFVEAVERLSKDLSVEYTLEVKSEDTPVVATRTKYDIIGESTIIDYAGHDAFITEKYNDCPDDQFGIPETRSFPLNTKDRVYSACKLFGHAPDQYKVQLAKNIFKAMRRYDIPKSYIGPKSQIAKYLKYW